MSRLWCASFALLFLIALITQAVPTDSTDSTGSPATECFIDEKDCACLVIKKRTELNPSLPALERGGFDPYAKSINMKIELGHSICDQVAAHPDKVEECKSKTFSKALDDLNLPLAQLNGGNGNQCNAKTAEVINAIGTDSTQLLSDLFTKSPRFAAILGDENFRVLSCYIAIQVEGYKATLVFADKCDSKSTFPLTCDNEFFSSSIAQSGDSADMWNSKETIEWKGMNALEF